MRQELVVTIKQGLNDLQKQVALLSQVAVETTTGGVGAQEIAQFKGQIELAFRLLHLTRQPESGAEIGMDDSRQGIQLRRLSHLRFRLLVAPHSIQVQGIPVMRGWKSGIGGNSGSQRLLRGGHIGEIPLM